MKTTAIHRSLCSVRSPLPVPNAATRRQIMDRIVDLTLTFMLGAGAAAIVLFVLAIA